MMVIRSFSETIELIYACLTINLEVQFGTKKELQQKRMKVQTKVGYKKLNFHQIINWLSMVHMVNRCMLNFYQSDLTVFL